MIIVSKRCYLNILTQLMNRDTLLNANYYLFDITTPNRMATMGTQQLISENGQLVVEEGYLQTGVQMGLGKYHVRYGSGELDPTPFMTSLLGGINNEQETPHNAFIKYLMKPDIMVSIYQFLFRDEPSGNHLQIGIISNDMVVQEFGHLICVYLSKNYGVDITFIDPQYRPNVYGQIQYPGDKIIGQKTIKDVTDYQLILEFKATLTQTGYDEPVNNIRVWLKFMNFYQLVHLYELIFPNEPLPPNNYTNDDLIDIIIGKTIAIRNAEREEMSSDPLGILSSGSWRDTVDRYNRESADFAQDDYDYE